MRFIARTAMPFRASLLSWTTETLQKNHNERLFRWLRCANLHTPLLWLSPRTLADLSRHFQTQNTAHTNERTLCRRLFEQERARGDLAVALPTRAPMACEFTKSHTAGGPGQLDHWERVELKRILEAQGGGGVYVGGVDGCVVALGMLIDHASCPSRETQSSLLSGMGGGRIRCAWIGGSGCRG